MVYTLMRVGSKSHIYEMFSQKGLKENKLSIELNLNSPINVIIGNNGSGKTTLLNGMNTARYLKLTQGKNLQSDPYQREGYCHRGLWIFKNRDSLKKEFQNVINRFGCSYSDEKFDWKYSDSYNLKGIYDQDYKIKILKHNLESIHDSTSSDYLLGGHVSEKFGMGPLVFTENVSFDKKTYSQLFNSNFCFEVLNYSYGGQGGRVYRLDELVGFNTSELPLPALFDFSRLTEKKELEQMGRNIKATFGKEYVGFLAQSTMEQFLNEKSTGEKVISIIDTLYNLCLKYNLKKNTIFIDEIQTGLSPMNQENVSEYLALISEIKNAPQIFITTHSPFVISQLPEDTIITDLNIEKNGGKIIQHKKGDVSDIELFQLMGYMGYHSSF